MNLNKIVSTVLIVLMLLDGAIPASAGGGQKITIEQREGDSIIVDRYIPQKRRRLESSEIIGTQGLKRTFLIDETNLIVMSLEKTPVMAFACFSDAVRWLRVNGWNCRGAPSIKNAILKKYLSCGWRWDIQIKTKETEKLLVSNPTEEQMREAKGFNIIRGVIAETKLLVMKLKKVPVKAFTNINDACEWLRKNGWESSNCSNVSRAVEKQYMLHGWEWEIRDKTGDLARLLVTEPTEEQMQTARKCMRKKLKIDENELIVMKSGEVPVKTFTEVFEAVNWLKSNGWTFANYSKITQIIRKKGFLYGWKWEKQEKTKELEKLLGVEPVVEQFQVVKNPKLNSVDENVSHDDDLSTSGIPICTLPSLHDTTVEKEGLADTDDYCETAIFDEVGLQRDVLMYDFEKEEEMFSSEEIFSELYY